MDLFYSYGNGILTLKREEIFPKYSNVSLLILFLFPLWSKVLQQPSQNKRKIAAQDSLSDIPPVAPLRKSRSRGTSLADDDRTSRGADSTILPDDDERSESRGVEKELQAQIVAADIKPLENLEKEKFTDISGYAVVIKDKKRPPPRPTEPSRKQFHNQFEHIKSHGKNIFFTYPRRAIKSFHKPPVRPTRNYSTLGPLRPPRRRKPKVLMHTIYHEGETDADLTDKTITKEREEHEKERDLQSGEVVMRMKGRPLPPPPRPPRRSKEYDVKTENEILVANIQIEQEIEPNVLQENNADIKKMRESLFKVPQTKSEEIKLKDVILPETVCQTIAQQTSFDYGEVSVSVQTDPLPQDVILVDSQSETEELVPIISPLITTKRNKGLQNPDSIAEKNIEIKEVAEEIPKRIDESSPSPEKEKDESKKEKSDSNIFHHALKRVEAARGVLQEARERVTPTSLRSRFDERRTEVHELKESSFVRVPQKESLSASSRSDEIEKEEIPPPLPIRPAYTRPIPVSFPDKLHLSELDVDKLNVSELQAGKLTVSEVESNNLQITEISSRGGNLKVGGIELPPDFISNIVSQVSLQVSSQVIPQISSCEISRECTPQRQIRSVFTPPPSIIVQPSSEIMLKPEPQVSEKCLREQIPKPKTTRAKGRRTPTRVIDDSEDELAIMMPQRREKEEQKQSERRTENKAKKDEDFSDSRKSPNLSRATSTQLMLQLVTIWHQNVLEGSGVFVQGVNSLFPEGEKRRDAQIAAVILLVLVTGLILIGFGFDNSVHHHHWDYVPPR